MFYSLKKEASKIAATLSKVAILLFFSQEPFKFQQQKRFSKVAERSESIAFGSRDSELSESGPSNILYVSSSQDTRWSCFF